MIVSVSEELIDKLLMELTKFAFICEFSLTFSDAEHKLKNNIYDYVILDLNLPDMQGVELFDSVKNITGSKIITLFDENDVHMKEYVYSKGVVDYINKNNTFEYLFHLIYKTIITIESNKIDNKVLIIDSSFLVCQQCTTYLTMRNYEVATTSILDIGIKNLKKMKYNLLLLDLDVLGMKQYQYLNEIKKIDKNLPIVLLSSTMHSSLLPDVYKNEASDFLFKPLNVEALISKVDFWIIHNRKINQLERNHKLLIEYKSIVDSFAIVSKIDVKGTLTYVNDVCCDTSGYSKSDLIGKPFSIVNHEDLPKKTYEEMWTTLKLKKTIWHGKVKSKRKDGTPYYVDSYIMPILDSNGEIIEFIALRNKINEFDYKTKTNKELDIHK